MTHDIIPLRWSDLMAVERAYERRLLTRRKEDRRRRTQENPARVLPPPGPRTVRCPTCGQLPGDRCATGEGALLAYFHDDRIRKWEEANAKR